MVRFTVQLLLARAGQLQPCLHLLFSSLVPPAPLAMTAEPGALEHDEAAEQLQADIIAAIVRVRSSALSCMQAATLANG